MRLDQSAAQAINLFPQASDGDKNMSLFGLLNRCKTAMGSRLLKRWLKQPLLDIPLIEKRLEIVALFCEEAHVRQGLRTLEYRRIGQLHEDLTLGVQIEITTFVYI
jgi:DNA mismatch repair protein MSH2